ncbi:glycoside hydrolase family 13 protein [Calocera cornea HHB12733]|uniref:Glycoside hydrolase family 13 protein n=1 Tax=Calocera cornea HHB12733 TaxID=1353952 RepID=A0A165ELG2_9BASI|nr:glycoside hydrolase family 13 protein [Calocera cornea HHB12733]
MSTADRFHEPAWWKSTIVYQIYPASFKDSNGDGHGDLRGITSKLDYLKDLGVDMIWLCPIYKSPMADMGYDISDYQDINPTFGTLADWEELKNGLHSRGMKLIMDLVVNHTSDEHPWFIESRSSKTSPKRDWYFWRPARYVDGVRKAPNNWRSIFGGPAWEWDEATQEYYLHIFATEQPDLNWETPALRKAVQDMMDWWLQKGINGFRLDAINLISKQPGLPDAEITEPDEELQSAFSRYNHGPRVHEWLQELHANVLDKYDAFTVGETSATNPEQAMQYIRQDRNPKELQMIFNTDLYQHLDLFGPWDTGAPPPKDLPGFKRTISKWQTYMQENGGWNSIYLENHDHPRSLIRFMTEEPKYRELCSKALCVVLSTLSGTLFVYQGQEIGMINLPKEWGIEEYQDVATKNWYSEALEKRQKETGQKNPDMSGIMAGIHRKARDNSRLPMQWDTSPNGGFSTGKPWMRSSPDAQVCNVAQQTTDPDSVFHFWRKMLNLRKESPILVYGSFEDMELSGAERAVFAYIRKLEDKALFVAVNFTEQDVPLDLSASPVDLDKLGTVLLSNYEGTTLDRLTGLKPYQAVICEISL